MANEETFDEYMEQNLEAAFADARGELNKEAIEKSAELRDKICNESQNPDLVRQLITEMEMRVIAMINFAKDANRKYGKNENDKPMWPEKVMQEYIIVHDKPVGHLEKAILQLM